MKRRLQNFSVLITVLLILSMSGCSWSATNPTPELPASTPKPPALSATFMPAFSGIEISEINYGKKLTLHHGDIFKLNRIKDDQSPLIIDNPEVVQIIGDPGSSAIILKTAGIGTTRITAFVPYPCPNAPIGCVSPPRFVYATIEVIEPSLQPSAYPGLDKTASIAQFGH